jgi:hypothetical protein
MACALRPPVVVGLYVDHGRVLGKAFQPTTHGFIMSRSQCIHSKVGFFTVSSIICWTG